MSDLNEVLGDFTSDLTRVRDLMGLIKDFRDFGSSSPPDSVTDGSIVWKEAMTLKKSAPTLRTDLPLVSGSMVLYVSGRFEYFVRQVIESLSDEIANHATEYSELPIDLRNELKKRTVDVVKTPGRYGFSDAEADALLVTLASNLDSRTEAGPIMIVSRVLSITDSNMRSEVLADLMRRVGFKDLWKELGKQARLKAFLQKPTDADCTTTAQRKLNDLMRERNQIAHPTGGTSFPDPDQVIWITNYLETLGTVLVDVCHVHLSVFSPAASTSTADPFV